MPRVKPRSQRCLAPCRLGLLITYPNSPHQRLRRNKLLPRYQDVPGIPMEETFIIIELSCVGGKAGGVHHTTKWDSELALSSLL